MLIQKQNINFTGNLENKATIFFIIEELKENSSRFFTKSYESFLIFFFAFKMTENNILNIKISNSQLNKLKLGIENGTQVAFKI